MAHPYRSIETTKERARPQSHELRGSIVAALLFASLVSSARLSQVWAHDEPSSRDSALALSLTASSLAGLVYCIKKIVLEKRPPEARPRSRPIARTLDPRAARSPSAP